MKKNWVTYFVGHFNGPEHQKENGRNFIASFPRDCIKVKEGLFSADLLLPQSRNLVELQGHLPYQPPASFY